MRNREDILTDLVNLNGNLFDLQKEISGYTWDAPQPLLVVKKADLLNVLQKSIDDDIIFDNLENWANFLECRDDIDFENDDLQEIIFELSNPLLNGKITVKRLKAIVNDLK
jgi:hypothetical protein